jgi:hypothetical protein
MVVVLLGAWRHEWISMRVVWILMDGIDALQDFGGTDEVGPASESL